MTQMTRRSFLAVTAGAPLLMGMQDKAGTRLPVMGSGEFTYEVHHDWGQLPAHIAYGNTHAVAEDSQGRIYIHHTVHAASQSADTIVVFDERGKFVRSWGKQFKGGAHGLHIQKEGRDEFLYLSDSLHGIVTKRTLDGEEVFTLGYPQESKPYERGGARTGLNYRPTNVAVAPNGDVYVADGYGSHYVHQYNKEAQYIRTFGGPGKEVGQLSVPHGIWVDTRGAAPVVIVAERSNARLQTFTLDGQHIGFVDGVKQACHFRTHQDVAVVADLAARVTLLDRNNRVIAHLGEGGDTARTLRTKSRDAFIAGEFICPHDAAFDHRGNIFVAEWVEIGRITKLRRVS
jgi:DNA-binding beta-propeller fold protein YncE